MKNSKYFYLICTTDKLEEIAMIKDKYFGHINIIQVVRIDVPHLKMLAKSSPQLQIVMKLCIKINNMKKKHTAQPNVTMHNK